MKRARYVLIGLISSSTLLMAQVPPPAQTRPTAAASRKVQGEAAGMSNQDINNMIAAGLSEPVVVNAIRQASKRDFDLSPMALNDLKKKGVSDAIIAEMQKASAPATAVAPAASRVPSSSVSLTREGAAEIIEHSALFTAVETVVVKQALNCSPGGPKDRYGAAPGESDADYFRRMQAEILNPSIPQARETQGGAIDALRSAGFLRVQQSAGCGVDRQRGALQGTVTVLTPEGTSASKQWRQIDANTWEVPMGRRAVVAVTGIKGDGQAAAAEFSWRWVSPQTGVAAGTRIVAAEALFERYDDGWRLNTSRLRDYFYDGWGKMIVPPSYSHSAVPSNRVVDTSRSGSPESQQPTIELGQSPTQIEAALGKPDNIVKLGPKTIYVYKTIKVTFVDGKVSERVAIP